jgi:RNA polymerase sigma factor (TIGR02999 family)
MNEVTRILDAVAEGRPGASEQLLPLVYGELRRLASAKLAREAAGSTLQPTALVHEAYLRLVGDGRDRQWQNRAHFFGAAAEAMRRVLVEHARQKRSQKRGGGLVRHSVDDLLLAAPEPDEDLVALDEALRRLAEKDHLKARLVELRYFAGTTLDEAAEILEISPTTAKRAWAFARAWLFREMTRDQPLC